MNTKHSKIENDIGHSSYISENAINMLFDQVKAASTFIENKCPEIPKTGIILGTGLKGLVDKIDILHKIPFVSIPHFPESTVISHGADLVIGSLDGFPVIVLTGRFHYYEGYTMQEVTFGVRVLDDLGIENLLITNITGSVNAHYRIGDIVMVKDHINLQSSNPLRMKNYDDRLGPRFPSTLHAYSPDLRTLTRKIASLHKIDLHEGIYTAMDGPSLETPAEYEMIHNMGGDIIGMSTVPEVIVAKQRELNTLVLSIVSNQCYPISELQEDSIETILANVEKGVPNLKKLVRETLKALD